MLSSKNKTALEPAGMRRKVSNEDRSEGSTQDIGNHCYSSTDFLKRGLSLTLEFSRYEATFFVIARDG